MDSGAAGIPFTGLIIIIIIIIIIIFLLPREHIIKFSDYRLKTIYARIMWFSMWTRFALKYYVLDFWNKICQTVDANFVFVWNILNLKNLISRLPKILKLKTKNLCGRANKVCVWIRNKFKPQILRALQSNSANFGVGQFWSLKKTTVDLSNQNSLIIGNMDKKSTKLWCIKILKISKIGSENWV